LKRRTVAIAVVLCAATVVVMMAFSRKPEPRYEGRPISFWVARLVGNHSASEVKQAEAAIRAIGTNGLPYLIDSLANEPPEWRVKIAHYVPGWLPGSRKFTSFLRADGKIIARVFSTLSAFAVLGPDAAPAIPALEAMMNDTNRVGASLSAVYALSRIGPPGFPALTNALAIPQHPHHAQIAINLCRLAVASYDRGESPAPYLPVLRQLFSERSTWVRTTASNVVSELEGNVDASRSFPR
jgi:hypothetical protein